MATIICSKTTMLLDIMMMFNRFIRKRTIWYIEFNIGMLEQFLLPFVDPSTTHGRYFSLQHANFCVPKALTIICLVWANIELELSEPNHMFISCIKTALSTDLLNRSIHLQIQSERFVKTEPIFYYRIYTILLNHKYLQ